jgi:hypothetical protein
MSVLDEALVSYLKSVSGITTLVSTRVYSFSIPQSATLPCLVIQRIDTPRELTMDMSGATGTLAHPRFQFDAWATTYASAKAITDAVRAALNGKTGSTGAGAVTVTLRASLAGNETDGFDPNVRLYYRVSDFVIWFEE